MLGQSDTIKEFQPRFPVLYYVIVGAFFVLGLRLFYLQVYRGSVYRRFSEQNSLRKEKLPGPRGQIVDRQGKVLVDNRLQLDITITPQFSADPRSVIEKIAQLTGESPERLFQVYKTKGAESPKFQPITLIENVSWPVVVSIESSKAVFSGINVEPRILRTYLDKDVGAQLYGYLSEVNKNDIEKKKGQKDFEYEVGDFLGRSGIEQRWERYLKGKDGIRFVEVNAHGHRVTTGDVQENFVSTLPKDILPSSGQSLQLTIDNDLQRAAAEGMKGKLGSVVALDPRTGEVLAMISNPSFDPTELSRNPELWPSIMKNVYGPLRNKSIQDHFPAGSTFKIFTALAALEAGVIDENTTFFCPGHFKFGRRIYNCHLQQGHGVVNLNNAIKGSCDVFFYNIASKMNIDLISKTAFEFGFGKKTGIELGQEVPGLMPTQAWKMESQGQPWTPGETLSASIGQGANLVTPLQLALAYATLVNGGNLYKPYVVSKIQDMDGNTIKSFKPELVSSHKLNAKFVEAIKEALYEVVNAPGGTAYRYARTREGLISGKSGTVQVKSMTRDELFKPCENLSFDNRHHAWFVGYAPRENPEIVVAVLGLHECGGSRNSSPVAKSVIDMWWKKKKEAEGITGPEPASSF